MFVTAHCWSVLQRRPTMCVTAHCWTGSDHRPRKIQRITETVKVVCVDKLKTLGCYIVASGSTGEDVEFQLSRARNALYGEAKVLSCTQVPVASWLRHFNKFVVPLALYACTTWNVSGP